MMMMIQDNFVAVVCLRDCSCAPILRFFSVASDGATAEPCFFGQFCSIFRKDSIANYEFGRSFQHLLEEETCFAKH